MNDPATDPHENRLPRVLGADSLAATLPHLRYSNESDVIGSVEKSPKGNTILRVGMKRADERTWESGKAHVVLTPDERDALLDALVAQRDEQRPEGRVLYALTREDLNELAGTKVTDEQADQFAAAFPNTSVNECVYGCIDSIGIGFDEDEEGDEDDRD